MATHVVQTVVAPQARASASAHSIGALATLLRSLAVAVSELGRGAAWGIESQALVSLCEGLASLGTDTVGHMHDTLVFHELARAHARYTGDGSATARTQAAKVSVLRPTATVGAVVPCLVRRSANF